MMSVRSTYQNRISENHKVDIHKDKIRNFQIDRHGPKINSRNQASMETYFVSMHSPQCREIQENMGIVMSGV